jgi:endonuclease-3
VARAAGRDRDRDRRLAAAVARRLAEVYPDARCGLDFQDPWQLLVATVLSAQCTDERVNRVTPELFLLWPGPAELASADVEALEAVIRPLGFHRVRTRALQAIARLVRDQHRGVVPDRSEVLTSLPGVGRKTATVVLGEGYGQAAGVVVDTHVRRVSRRLGLTAATDPDRIADELEELLDRWEWVAFSRRTITHGRRVCAARRPRCDECPLENLCGKVGV